MKKFFFIILITTGITFLTSYTFMRQQTKSEAIIPPPSIPQTTVTPKPVYSGWVPWWEEAAALESISTASAKLVTILPVWYNVSTQGTLIITESKHKQAIRESTKAKNIAVIPTIFNDFDGQRIHRLLQSETLQQKFITDMLQEADQYNYAGFDLDWEELSLKDTEPFHNFVTILSEELAKKNKILSVTVHAKTTDHEEWEPANVFDWQRLANIVSEIRIMAYDKHHSTSEAGPITPPEWLNQVIQYALQYIPPEKLVLGLPTYGYDWNEEKGTPLQYKDMIHQLKVNKTEFTVNESAMALSAVYTKDNEDHIVWFENASTVKEKVDLAKKYGIYRFSFWHLGGEDPKMWQSL